MKKARRNSNIYDSAITYENIYAMWNTIRKTCKNKKAIFYFSLNLNTNIAYIYHVLKNEQYIPSRYRTFMIFEPKPRLVMSQTVIDKIVNHFVANYYLIPLLENKLIDTNVATRKDKGSKYAMELLKKYFNKLLITEKEKEIYCLKIDISKYFYSIDHEVLISMLEETIRDKKVINLIKIIINETNQDYINNSIREYNHKFATDIPLYKNNKGLSIGAMSSQFLAIYYLNKLDHFIKENLKCKYYVRYMDDFLILDTDKNKLKQYWKIIVSELEKVKLKENKKSNISKSSVGFIFLGYRYQVINDKLRISSSKKTYQRIKKKLKYLKENDYTQYVKSFASYYGYFKVTHHLKEMNFKMKLIDIYDSFQKKYPTSLIIIKDGIFYKAFHNNAKIIWYLFDYKYLNDSVSFGNTPYDKVLARLNKLDISYVIVNKEKELLVVLKDKAIYESYVKLSTYSYNKTISNNKLIENVKKVIDNYPESYSEINSILEKYLKVET